MSEVVVTSVENMEQSADVSEADDKIISPERKAEICAGAASAACAACADSDICPLLKLRNPDAKPATPENLFSADDDGVILVAPGLLQQDVENVADQPVGENNIKETPTDIIKPPIQKRSTTPPETSTKPTIAVSEKKKITEQSKHPEAPIVPIATNSEKQTTIPRPEVEVPKKAPVENAPVDALHVIDRAVDRLPKFEPSNTPISSDTAIAAEQKPAIVADIKPREIQQIAAVVKPSVDISPKLVIAAETGEVNIPVSTHEMSRKISNEEMPVDDSELAPHVAPPVTKSVRAAAPTESDVKAVHTEIANESTPSSQKLSHSPSPPAEPVESKPVATVVEVPSQESCEISEPVITHQDVVNEIEVEPMRLVEHSSQITLRNHYESVFGSLAAPSPSPQEIEISEPEIDSGYAECEMSMAPKQIEPQVVAPEQPIYAELAVVSQEKVQNSHNAVVKTTPFHAPPTTLDIALPIVNTLDLGLPAAPFEMGDRARPLRAPVDPPNLRNNPQPEFSPEIPEKTITAATAPLSFSEGSDIPEDLVEEEYVTQNVSSDVLKRSTPTKKSEGEQHDRTTPADEILLTDTQEPEPANQGYGISGLIGELSELIGKLACAVAVRQQRLRSEYDLIA